jgi:hypothetical protein
MSCGGVLVSWVLRMCPRSSERTCVMRSFDRPKHTRGCFMRYRCMVSSFGKSHRYMGLISWLGVWQGAEIGVGSLTWVLLTQLCVKPGKQMTESFQSLQKGYWRVGSGLVCWWLGCDTLCRVGARKPSETTARVPLRQGW